LVQEIEGATLILAPVFSAVYVITLAVVAIIIIACLYNLSRFIFIVVFARALEAFRLTEAVKAATFIPIAIHAIFLIHKIGIIIRIKVIFNGEQPIHVHIIFIFSLSKGPVPCEQSY